MDVRVDRKRFNDGRRPSNQTAYVEFVAHQEAMEVLTYIKNSNVKFHIEGRNVSVNMDTKESEFGALDTLNSSLKNTKDALAAAQWQAAPESVVEIVDEEEPKKKKKKKRVQESAFVINDKDTNKRAREILGKNNPNYQPVVVEDDVIEIVSETKVDDLIKEVRNAEPKNEFESLPSMKEPNKALFQYDAESGYMFDPVTGYYYVSIFVDFENTEYLLNTNFC